MKEEVSNCGRESELISFLYGELNDIEARTFQRHLRECAGCNAELAAFGDVRESVVAWRNESLGALGAMVSPSEIAHQVTNVADARNRKATAPSTQSAWSALRQFFNLSPLWLKAAVAFATLLFCLLAGLAVARLREEPKVVVTNPAPALSQQEINALVDQGVQAELERRIAQQQQKDALTAKDSSPKNPVKRNQNRNAVVAETKDQKARRPLSKTEREQLAADLRLVSGKNDSELNLLDDRINQ
jgi:anti-sigma factor RsiW